ncbi:MAG: helix-turn-helix domain-containing protein [Succinivibrio sp.]
MDINQVISRNLQHLREQTGMSLGKLSEKTGLSKAVLSQIEKGNSNPTINTIWKIAEAFGVTYSALLESKRVTVEKVAYEDLAFQKDDDTHYRIGCYFSSNLSRNFELFLLELDPGVEHVTDGHKKISEEYLFVKEGSVEIVVDNSTFRLKEGDSMTFDGLVRHSYKNVSDRIAKVYCINYYPN